jgi:ribosomal protein S18 acetylase RimI-like enzyme
MSITQRRYKPLADFERVHRFLTDTYDPKTLNSYLLPQYWEYAHHLQWFDYIRTARMGLWEEDGEIVAIAAYEMNIGEVHLHCKRGYEELLPQLLKWAEAELAAVADGKRTLAVWITDKEQNKIDLLRSGGYECVHREPVKIFRYEKPWAERTLPEGFSLIDGANVDYAKLATCFWAGFDHNEPPPDINIDGNIQMCNTPHYRKDLMTIVVAPNGDYACALGMWLDGQNHYAYLEPLATLPEYRRMGLATIALTEAMKKTKALGAEYCFGGVPDFYTAIGFETVCHRELWKKEWTI